MAALARDGIEEETRQGTRAHGRNLTTKVTGEPGTAAPVARRALAVITTLSGGGGASSRAFTAAVPVPLVITVSTVTSACAVSLVTRVTGPGAG